MVNETHCASNKFVLGQIINENFNSSSDIYFGSLDVNFGINRRFVRC